MVSDAALLREAFFDTSVLLAGVIDFGPRSAAPQGLLDAVAAGRLGRPRTAWHCCLELYSVATRLPQEFRLAPADAVAILQSEVLSRFEVLALPPIARREFLAACGREDVRGGRLYDAHIAAVARSGGVRLVITDNPRDFAVLQRVGIRVAGATEAFGLLPRKTRPKKRRR